MKYSGNIVESKEKQSVHFVFMLLCVPLKNE